MDLFIDLIIFLIICALPFIIIQTYTHIYNKFRRKSHTVNYSNCYDCIKFNICKKRKTCKCFSPIPPMPIINERQIEAIRKKRQKEHLDKMGCDYCNGTKPLFFDDLGEEDVICEYVRIENNYMLGYNFDVKIKFCPICGRELNENGDIK